MVFVAFGVMSAVWYLISASRLLACCLRPDLSAGGRYHYKGPPLPEDDAASSTPQEKEHMPGEQEKHDDSEV